jgi:bacterioferritin (cytochrome b1)
MKGHLEIIALVNEALAGEPGAINQHFLHGNLIEQLGDKLVAQQVAP